MSADAACARHTLCNWGSWKSRQIAIKKLHEMDECPTKASGIAFYGWLLAHHGYHRCEDESLSAAVRSLDEYNCAQGDDIRPIKPLCDDAYFMSPISHGSLCLMIIGCALQMAILVKDAHADPFSKGQ